MLRSSLFGKIFTVLFLAIFIVLSVFAYKAYTLQKNSSLDSLHSEAKTMADAITFVNSEAFIMGDETLVLEFVYEFLQEQKQLESFIISRKDSEAIILKRDGWELAEKLSFYKLFQKKKSYATLLKSRIVEKDVFYYSYPVYISGVHWGWLHLELSLEEYNKKLHDIYQQFEYLALIMFLTSLLISYIIARMFSKPIVQLNNISKEVANGDLTLRVNISSKDEIGTLANSFNKMVENLEFSQYELKKSHDELEDRVLQRTKELNEVNEQLKNKSYELKELNENLEHKVSEEIKKQQEQEQILIQQSRLAAMGEMIGNIAHQWRQPLNSLGLVIQNIHFTYKIGDLDDEFIDKAVNKANLITKSMSKTIDDFRNFFKPNKERVVLDVDQILKKSISLIEMSFEYNSIVLEYESTSQMKIYGFANEFSQVILNILSNAKDALLDNKIENAKVTVKIKKKEEFIYVKIQDNAGGIDKKILDKIFEPYFTTKEEGKGTGIGLYMSKTIIENNMQGKLSVKNEGDGARFTIKIPAYEGRENE